ncbi:hypothetical protein ACIRQP_34280 [Streptomyces sp. NPDC102274]|uniref:hypothetical protein n=1 Tax=Streptomyces sp. NPDC102274 TaxID=3366151 RepID=UPI003800FA60
MWGHDGDAARQGRFVLPGARRGDGVMQGEEGREGEPVVSMVTAGLGAGAQETRREMTLLGTPVPW